MYVLGPSSWTSSPILGDEIEIDLCDLFGHTDVVLQTLDLR